MDSNASLKNAVKQTVPAQTLSVYYHTHWDREWYEPFASYQLRLARVLDKILERLESGALPSFMLDGQTSLLHDYLAFRPSHRERIQKLVTQKKLAIGPWFVMPDEFLVCGESLLRNLQKGIADAKSFGETDWCGYLPDTFGHCADMPTLLQAVGIDAAVLWRGLIPDSNAHCWHAPSGEKVALYHLTEGYFQNLFHDRELSEEDRKKTLKNWFDSASKASALWGPLLPIGGDHLGALSGSVLAQLNNAALPLQSIQETLPVMFIRDQQKRCTLDQLPLLSGELRETGRIFLLPAVASARVYLKQANRRLTHRLLHTLEPLQVLNRLFFGSGNTVIPEITAMWDLLLLNHPHDSICGCSVDSVHRDNEQRFESVRAMQHALLPWMLRPWAGWRDSDSGWSLPGKQPDNQHDQNSWTVFYGGSSPYTGIAWVEGTPHADRLAQVARPPREVLKDEYLTDEWQVPLSHRKESRSSGWVWVENIQPLSVTRIDVASSQTIPEKSRVWTLIQDHASEKTVFETASLVPKYCLENEYLQVAVDEHGEVTVFDKRTHRAYPIALSFIDREEQGDSYNSVCPQETLEKAVCQGVHITKHGPAVGEITVLSQFQNRALIFSTQIQLHAASSMLHCQTQLLNQSPNRKIQVCFETGAPIEKVLLDSHLSVISREVDPAYNANQLAPVEKGLEYPSNAGPLQRFVLANGQAIFTEGLSEYEISGSSLQITLLRAFSHLSKGILPTRGAPAGPPLETPEAQCINRPLVLRYAWTPVDKESTSEKTGADGYLRAWHLADQFLGNIQLLETVDLSDSFSKGLIQWDNPAIISTALTLVSQTQIVLRLLNISPDSQTQVLGLNPRLIDGLDSIYLVDGLHQPIGQEPLSVRGVEISVTLEPWQWLGVLFQLKPDFDKINVH
ncbi:MAG: hypothetical protein K2X01_09465 [Cyanobacteria bacterium]|nr:hypothetical protein [Cyanobacteriota bacterium]